MADTSVTMSHEIPTVTEDDLRSFHARHFGLAHEPSTFFVSQTDLEPEDDDGLGYYPDGVKRTLTEDQVAMFRHSEIQALLRERRLQRETSEQDEGPRKCFGISSKNQAPPGSPKQQQGTDGGRTWNQTKRKWENFIDDSEANPDHLTHRRMARELDELRQDSVELAYGEDDADTVSDRPVVDPCAPIHLKRPTFQWPTLGAATSACGSG